jgi:hypothetical protein
MDPRGGRRPTLSSNRLLRDLLRWIFYCNREIPPLTVFARKSIVRVLTVQAHTLDPERALVCHCFLAGSAGSSSLLPIRRGVLKIV